MNETNQHSIPNQQVSVCREQMRDSLAFKTASSLILQAAELLERERLVGSVKGIDEFIEEAQRLSNALKQLHLDCVAQHTCNVEKLTEKLMYAQLRLQDMHDNRLTSSSTFLVEQMEFILADTKEELVQAAFESDDAIDDVLTNIDPTKDFGNMIEHAVDLQFADWDPDHSTYNPYDYQNRSEKLKRELSEAVSWREHNA